MKFKKIIFFIVILFTTFTVKSQIDASNANLVEYQLESYYNDYLTHKIGTESSISYENIDGDPYLYKDFTKGIIKFEKDKNLVGQLRYNMYSDEVEFMYQNNILILIYEDSFSGIRMGDYNLIQLTYSENGGQSKTGYFIYLVKGSYDLLSKKSVSFYEQEKPKLYSESKPGRFEKNPDKFYLRQPDKELYEINNIYKLKKYSDELALLVDEYTKENKIRINKESLSDFFKWVNSK